MRSRSSGWAAVLYSLLQVGVGCAAEVQGSLGVSTDNVFRGLTQSHGEASAQLDGYVSATHWFGGVGAETVERERNLSTGAEVIGYLGYQQLLSEDWSSTLSFRHYDYPGNPLRSRYYYDELSATVSWRQRVLLELIASPNTDAAASYDHFGRGSAYAAELTGRQPLPYGVTADAGIGFYDLRPEVGSGYAYWSAGLSRQWLSWQLTLRYIGTDAEARHLFKAVAGDRVVASVAWFF